ncbi:MULTISPECIES: envelope stress response membrane protein PspB [unclassified Novosphingobium]|uniref:envelope stress response membrane protein PspB n=1 Tax=unclassified Novosphingobium TaxID=2644732 RepID=UPI00146D312C|nr:MULTISPECIES: envelope stress response membrane protein PspB [unclassified Novosphingobium]NMN03425.1 phage shock protein B [Novosphingobium sp. SG919]NMN86585.1 phage shock protein B [Novosphingobium sp. SG916]
MDIESVMVLVALFIGLPWVILHYITKWKTASTLTSGDEQLLEELYRLARRLEERMDTVERLVASENPQFRPARLGAERDSHQADLSELDRLMAQTKGTVK